jgi:uncharacterized PurR-regulated membrane protein YhhQ (DUF165 family)
MTKIVTSVAFLACIIGANWALTRFGVVPVGFGLMAPAGVYFAGLSFGLRDAVQELGGRAWTVGLIVVGAGLSALIDPTFAVASGCAFLLAELADFAVYTPLRERQWIGAVVASNAVGSVVDSAVFLWIAFGSLDFMAGQVWGKTLATIPAIAIVWWARGRRAVAA